MRANHDTRGGDWWAGKGVALARLELAPGRFLDVYNTHMICSLGPAELHAHRLTQAQELLEFAQRTTPLGLPALVVGDFNCGPGSKEFDMLESGLGWCSLLEQGSWIDHVQAFSPQASYAFELLEEGRVHGAVQVGTEQVSLSDHNGLYVRVRVVPSGWPPAPLRSAQGELAPTGK